jgi:hypothetical protein
MTNSSWKLNFQKIVFDYSPGIHLFGACLEETNGAWRALYVYKTTGTLIHAEET